MSSIEDLWAIAEQDGPGGGVRVSAEHPADLFASTDATGRPGLLLVTDARWKLYFASDLGNEIHIIDAVDVGTTADIIGCYTILEALRVIFRWIEETFAPWFLNGLKPE